MKESVLACQLKLPVVLVINSCMQTVWKMVKKNNCRPQLTYLKCKTDMFYLHFVP